MLLQRQKGVGEEFNSLGQTPAQVSRTTEFIAIILTMVEKEWI